jgi:hypothetical protein
MVDHHHQQQHDDDYYASLRMHSKPAHSMLGKKQALSTVVDTPWGGEREIEKDLYFRCCDIC